MIIAKPATTSQCEYACKNYHYSKRCPPYVYAYSFYNDNRFCGVITFGNANRAGGIRFNLLQGECLELNRCALNGQQICTSKCVSLAIKQLKKQAPHVKLLVSYADSRQGHIGTIYQATNWFYDGVSICTPGYMIDGQFVHKRNLWSYDKQRLRQKNIEKIKPMPKHRYYYPLNDELKKQLNEIKKPYPKKKSD